MNEHWNKCLNYKVQFIFFFYVSRNALDRIGRKSRGILEFLRSATFKFRNFGKFEKKGKSSFRRNLKILKKIAWNLDHKRYAAGVAVAHFVSLSAHLV